jgi:hypothetical protein
MKIVVFVFLVLIRFKFFFTGRTNILVNWEFTDDFYWNVLNLYHLPVPPKNSSPDIFEKMIYQAKIRGIAAPNRVPITSASSGVTGTLAVVASSPFL